jgi:mono/diheme cytochrome c family protein
MKRRHLALLIAAVMLGGILNAPGMTQTAQKDQDDSQKTASSTPELDGGTVFQRYCGQCHGERYPTERIKDRWTIISTHMRIRGQLTGKEAEAVLQYLYDNARQKKQRTPEPATSTREEIAQ